MSPLPSDKPYRIVVGFIRHVAVSVEAPSPEAACDKAMEKYSKAWGDYNNEITAGVESAMLHFGYSLNDEYICQMEVAPVDKDGIPDGEETFFEISGYG